MIATPIEDVMPGQPPCGCTRARYTPSPAWLATISQLLLAPEVLGWSAAPSSIIGGPTNPSQSPAGSGPWKPISSRTLVRSAAGRLRSSIKLTDTSKAPLVDCTTSELSTATVDRKRYLLATASCR